MEPDIIIIIIVSSVTVSAGVLFVHQPGANHAPRASVTQVNHSVLIVNRILIVSIVINKICSIIKSFCSYTIIIIIIIIIIIVIIVVVVVVVVVAFSLQLDFTVCTF